MLDTVRHHAAEAPFLVSVDGDTPISWLVFCALNADAFDAGELAAMRREIEAGGSYAGGGGAAEPWVIRAVAPADGTMPGSAESGAAQRLLAAALAGSVDLGDATACAVWLASGPGGDPSATWDAVAAARTAVIRAVQAAAILVAPTLPH